MKSLSRPRIKKKIKASVETEAQKKLAVQVIGLLKGKGVEPCAGFSASGVMCLKFNKYI